MAGSMGGAVNFGDGLLDYNGANDAFIVKLDGDGDWLWGDIYGTNQADGTDVAVTNTGEVLVSGLFNVSINFGGGAVNAIGNRDIFAVRLSQ